MSTRDRGGSWASTVLQLVVNLAWSLDSEMMVVSSDLKRLCQQIRVNTPDKPLIFGWSYRDANSDTIPFLSGVCGWCTN